jgi:hypothetical protein
MTASYVVAPATLPNDKPELIRLWTQNLGVDDADARFEWLYGGAVPASRGWVLRTGDGALVGAAALAARRFQLRGRPASGAQAIDFVIDRQHRTLGPALDLQSTVTRSLVSDGVGLAYALPNAKAEPVLIRSGYKRLGAFHRWSRLLRYDDALIARNVNPTLAGVLSGAMVALDGLRLQGIRHRSRFQLVEQREFDHRFDALWEQGARQFEVVGERSAAYLRWRFCGLQSGGHRVAALVGQNGTLLGYVVWRLEGSVVRVADTFATDWESWQRLLQGFIRRMRQSAASAINILHFGSPRFEALLSSLDFSRRASDTSVLVQSGRTDVELPAPASWHMTEADRDV